MAEQSNDGSFRISGRYGEVFIVKRAPGNGPPVGIKLMEVESIEATRETAVVDVPLPGTGEIGDKDGPTTSSGTLVVQHIFPEWEEYHDRTALSGTLAQRRRDRDAGNRLDRSLTLQVWLDDPSALGAIGWQIEGLRLYRLAFGFSQDEVLNREHPFRFRNARMIRSFQRIGAQVDPVTGLPAIEYTIGRPS